MNVRDLKDLLSGLSDDTPVMLSVFGHNSVLNDSSRVAIVSWGEGDILYIGKGVNDNPKDLNGPSFVRWLNINGYIREWDADAILNKYDPHYGIDYKGKWVGKHINESILSSKGSNVKTLTEYKKTLSKEARSNIDMRVDELKLKGERGGDESYN